MNPGISLGDAVVDAQGNASIDILFASPGPPVVALQFDIRYQPQQFGISVSSGSAIVSAEKILSTSNPEPTLLRVLIAGMNQTSIGDGVIATLSLQANAGAVPADYPLSFENAIASDSNGMAVFLPTSVGPAVSAVTNAASSATGAVAPGEIVVIYGAGMGPAQLQTMQIPAAGQVATTLAGTRVLLDGIPAPMLYTTANQVSAIVPYEIDGRSGTSLQVEYNGIPSTPFLLPVANAALGVFTQNTSGQGQGAVVNQDGTINSPDQPALRGSVISVYGTGDGQTVPQGVDGLIVSGPQDLRTTLLPVTASIGGQDATVLYAGSIGGGLASVLQVNLLVPLNLEPSPYVPVNLTIGTSSIQTGVTIAIQ